MRGMRNVTCLWPGLSPLWYGGAWSGLATAVLFSLLLNFSLIVTFLWFETVAPTTRWMLWGTTGAAWLVSGVVSSRWLARQSRPRTNETTEDLFRQGQCEYLRGNWIAAEIALLKVLGLNTKDVDARLMLVTLYRHTRRLSEARTELEHLERWEAAVKWQWEIGRERLRLAEAEAQLAERTEPTEEESPLLGDATGETVSDPVETLPEMMDRPLAHPPDQVSFDDATKPAIAA